MATGDPDPDAAADEEDASSSESTEAPETTVDPADGEVAPAIDCPQDDDEPELRHVWQDEFGIHVVIVVHTRCPEAQVIADDDARFGLYVGAEHLVTGTFDCRGQPVALPAEGTSDEIELVFDAEADLDQDLRTRVFLTTSEADAGPGGFDLRYVLVCEPGDGGASGASVGSDGGANLDGASMVTSDEPAPTSPPTPDGDDDAAALAALERIHAETAPERAALSGPWVPQVSAKSLGDDATYDVISGQTIVHGPAVFLDRFRAWEARFGAAVVLLRGTDFRSICGSSPNPRCQGLWIVAIDAARGHGRGCLPRMVRSRAPERDRRRPHHRHRPAQLLRQALRRRGLARHLLLRALSPARGLAQRAQQRRGRLLVAAIAGPWSPSSAGPWRPRTRPRGGRRRRSSAPGRVVGGRITHVREHLDRHRPGGADDGGRPAPPGPTTTPGTTPPACARRPPRPSPPGRCGGGWPCSSWSASTRPDPPRRLALVEEHHVGGLFVGGNDTGLLTSGALADLRAASPTGLMVAVDEEGGRVQRVDGLDGDVPSAREMAATMTPEEVRALARRRGEVMADAGVTIDLAPVVDVSDQPDGTVIGDRSWSADPDGRRHLRRGLRRGARGRRGDAGAQALPGPRGGLGRHPRGGGHDAAARRPADP